MPTPNEYDISRAFKRIENDLIDSMVRNLKRHRAEEDELGIHWEQWQVLQLKELERYRYENASKFTEDFIDIDTQVMQLFYDTYNTAQTNEEAKILDKIIADEYSPVQTKDTTFFNLNDEKLNILLERTQQDFSRAEYAVLRKANDAYRSVIFDAQVYANVTNDYNKAVDMATHDFIKNGLQSIQYKNGARHNISDYARMAIRTGNKRAYLMGEGNARDKYGIHTVRVNRRTQACPLCVGYLGRVLVDDVYGGGTAKEAFDLGVPTLSSAMQAGFLHPNCKDIYSMYIDGISKPAKPWTQDEINEIVGEYNQEQALKHAEDMAESYNRLAKYALDPDNAQRYQARADNWQARADEIQNTPAEPATPPTVPPIVSQVIDFTDAQKDALEWYVSGDGMWVNQYLRGNGEFTELTDTEQQLLDLLTSATSKPLEATDRLYRSVDASVIFSDLSEEELSQMMTHLYYGDSAYDKGAYSQGIKKRMETALKRAQGREITEQGFMSTTIDKKVAEEFGDFTGAENPIVIEFDTKGKKLKGADLDFLDIEDDPQRERLLARNTRYKINDISVEKTEDGLRYVKVKAEIIDQAEEAVEEVVEQVAEQPKAFVPATTIEEANEFAKRFTDPSRFGAVGVSYEGVSVEVANTVNKTIDDFYNTYAVEPFGGIIAPKGNTKLGKLVDGATAGYSPIRHSFILNRKSLKSVAVAEKSLLAEREAVTKILANPEKYDLSKVNSAVRKTIENAVTSGRGTIPLTVEEVLWHELGHTLERGIAKTPYFANIKANMEIYAPRISGYATTELSEYIAESFCSFMKGEGLVDPELIKAFDALRR